MSDEDGSLRVWEKPAVSRQALLATIYIYLQDREL